MWVLVLFPALLGLSSALFCPDGDMCNSWNTCCKNVAGEYACCPLPDAECCSDHVHCCYGRTVCDLVHGRCVNKTVSLPWMRRIPTKPTQRAPLAPQLQENQNIMAVVCPDREFECPEDTTCCQLRDGSWGCCMFAKAVCCEDKQHCCPEGATCDLEHSRCVTGQEAVPMLQKEPARRRDSNSTAPVGSVSCPGGQSSCPDSYTCCLLSSGDYGCCPYAQAVCCSDRLHCCPSNTECDMEHGACKTSAGEAPPPERIAAAADIAAIGRIICPDKSGCSDGMTCCKMSDGRYDCCPMPNAVCCSDRIHCCPEGKDCDVAHGACISRHRETAMTAMLHVATATLKEGRSKGGVVTCEGTMCCADGNTCCKLPNGVWSCCSFPEAVCCEDHMHCCPNGTVCNLENFSCDNASGIAVTKLSAKVPAFPSLAGIAVATLKEGRSKGGVVTCEGTMCCADGNTCCKLPNGVWSCCSFPEAVCCKDHMHCCPNGTVCNLENFSCDNASGIAVTKLSAKVPAFLSLAGIAVATLKEGRSKGGVVTCEGTMCCADGNTCCKLPNGVWSCCSFPEAVCCEDHMHCCPNGTVCNLENFSCDNASGIAVTKLSAKVPAVSSLAGIAVATLKEGRSKGGVVTCEGTMCCADGNTCCKLPNGVWSCCSFPEAVCCKDHMHCCPNGTVCNLENFSCDNASGNAVTKLSAKVPAFLSLAGNAVATLKEGRSKGGVVTCEGTMCCADGNTCCKLPNGVWSCCSFPEAVCCDDHMHCCPNGTVCNLENFSCDNASGIAVTKLSAKVPAFLSLAGNGKCDESTSCPGKTTCCQTKDGGWACCPLPQAVCCDDHLHCCPHNTVCNLAAETCDDPAGFWPSVRWLQKTPALRREPGVVAGPARPDRNMCDGQTSCPRDTTCCFMADTRRWGCCPLPKAVCCEDGLHCCPAGHACEPHRAACSKGPLVVVPWLSKLSARSEPGAVTDIKCDDQSSCASGTTCCKLQTGEWGCCPLVKAVCCADREHCCPQGYTCNMQTGTCEKTNPDALELPVLQIRVVRPDEEEEEDVSCDVRGDFRCSVRDTCCRVSASEWACCPAPQAVCCPDSKHCCPAGHSCDPAAGGCSQHSQRSQLTWNALRRRDFVPPGL